MEPQILEETKRMLLTHLPELIKNDPELRLVILRVTHDAYAGKQETESRFDRIMEELKRDREADMLKWQAQQEKWRDQEKKWDAQEKKWQSQEERWQEQDRKWAENQKTLNEIIASVKLLAQKHDASIGALGARWGLHSEASFRNGLKAILEKSFGVKVERYEDFDYGGSVFGRPDQVELDLIIHNGTLILCEIKSSMSKSDLYAFWRKKNFYEEKHGRKATRTMVISPMIDDKAKAAAKELAIELYGYAEDVVV